MSEKISEPRGGCGEGEGESRCECEGDGAGDGEGEGEFECEGGASASVRVMVKVSAGVVVSARVMVVRLYLSSRVDVHAMFRLFGSPSVSECACKCVLLSG